MPVVGRRHDDDVKLARLEHLAEVGKRLGPRALSHLHPVGTLAEQLGVDVAHRDDLDIRDVPQAVEVVIAEPAAANHADLVLLARKDRPSPAFRRAQR